MGTRFPLLPTGGFRPPLRVGAQGYTVPPDGHSVQRPAALSPATRRPPIGPRLSEVSPAPPSSGGVPAPPGTGSTLRPAQSGCAPPGSRRWRRVNVACPRNRRSTGNFPRLIRISCPRLSGASGSVGLRRTTPAPTGLSRLSAHGGSGATPTYGTGSWHPPEFATLAPVTSICLVTACLLSTPPPYSFARLSGPPEWSRATPSPWSLDTRDVELPGNPNQHHAPSKLLAGEEAELPLSHDPPPKRRRSPIPHRPLRRPRGLARIGPSVQP
jgi:hypothetical protein